MLSYVTTPLRTGPGHVLRCFIERNRSGINKLSPIYTLFLDLENGNGR
jgi:hypothetical protein